MHLLKYTHFGKFITFLSILINQNICQHHSHLKIKHTLYYICILSFSSWYITTPHCTVHQWELKPQNEHINNTTISYRKRK